MPDLTTTIQQKNLNHTLSSSFRLLCIIALFHRLTKKIFFFYYYCYLCTIFEIKEFFETADDTYSLSWSLIYDDKIIHFWGQLNGIRTRKSRKAYIRSQEKEITLSVLSATNYSQITISLLGVISLIVITSYFESFFFLIRKKN